jgi:ketosteroid isomerase-like protein
MKRSAVAIALLLCSVTLLAKTSAHDDIKQADRDFAAAFGARDVARFTTFLADEVRFSSGAGTWLEGKAAVVERWGGMMKNPNLTLTWEPRLATVSPDGKLGYTSGRSEWKLKKEDGTTAVSHGMYVTIWQKEKDGRWRVILDIGQPEKE